MRKDLTAFDLAKDLSQRSICNVQVAAVIVDRNNRVISWGWNHSGKTGRGVCAEEMAISRANPARLKGSSIFIYGKWQRSANTVDALPCSKCMRLIRKAGIEYVGHSVKSDPDKTADFWP